MKRSKMILISVLGAMVTPGMIFAEVIKMRLSKPDFTPTYVQIFDQNCMYMLIFFGFMVYSVFAAYLFSREYTENTLKAILTVPVSKKAFLMSKFITLLIWMIGLSTLTWVFTLIVGMLTGATGLSGSILIQSYKEILVGTIMLFGIITPLVFLSMYSRGIVMPALASIAIGMMNAVLSNEDWAALFPWSSVYLVATDKVAPTGFSMSLVIGFILLVTLVGFAVCVVYFLKEDIK